LIMFLASATVILSFSSIYCGRAINVVGDGGRGKPNLHSDQCFLQVLVCLWVFSYVINLCKSFCVSSSGAVYLLHDLFCRRFQVEFYHKGHRATLWGSFVRD
jgi:hypothetical protein